MSVAAPTGEPELRTIGTQIPMTDVARTFEVLAGEDIGYLGATPRQRFTAASTASAVTSTGDGREA